MRAEFRVNYDKYPHFDHYFKKELDILTKKGIKYDIFDDPDGETPSLHYDFRIYNGGDEIREFFKEYFREYDHGN